MASTIHAGLGAVQRLGQAGACQCATGHEQQRHQTARVALGAIVPHRVVGRHHLQARASAGQLPSWDQWSNGARALGTLMPGSIQTSRDLDQASVPEIDQVGGESIGQVGGGYQLGHHTQLGWKWPRFGHAAQYQVAVQIRLEVIALDEFDERGFGDVRLDRPTARDLRWVLLHLINETGRHAGHADATRELLDGTTGQ
jgi:hypothetical protein